RIELMTAEVERRRRELEAEVVEPALARAREVQAGAEARRDEIAALGWGEAEALRMKGIAEGEAMLAKARSWSEYNEAAITDLVGTWQHVGLSIHALDEDAFAEGLGFDGSSIRGFQEIAESDMVLVPDPTTAVIDPFHEQRTLSILCDIIDPITREPYSRD